jgi:tetratricopeptide (TPR) repeat protein
MSEMPPSPKPIPDGIAKAVAEMFNPQEGAPLPDLPRVAGYEIQRKLGRGGMGVVFQARDVKRDRTVALKMVPAGVHGDPRELARFRAEAEAVARLEHPNIVQVYEVGEQDGWAYLALEFVDGGPLSWRLQGTPQAIPWSAWLVETLARAVHYAHERGVLHRDLKPANVLLTPDGQPRITDFGLAKRLEGESGPTRTGEVLGTPGYMAPEQAQGRTAAVGPAADVYALGAILYELLTGRPPFKGETVVDTLLQARSEEPVPPRRLQPKVPRDLETICLKCLRTDPRRRYASAAALADDLHRFLLGEPIRARPPGAGERALKWARRRPTLTTALAGAVLGVLGLLAGVVWYNRQLSVALEEARREHQQAEVKLRQSEDQARVAGKRLELSLDALHAALATQRELAVKVGIQEPREKALHKALAGFQRLASGGETANSSVYDGLVHALLDLGDVLLQMGRPEEAYRQFDNAYRIVRDNPELPTARRYLTWSHTRLAVANRFLGKREAAEAHYLEALKLAQALAAADRHDTRAQADLVSVYYHLGDLTLDRGQTPAARDYFRSGLKIAETLAAADPRLGAGPRPLLLFYEGLGRVNLQLGDKAAARACYCKSLELFQLLAPPDRDNAEAQHDLATLYQHLGRVSLQLGEPETARDYQRKGLTIAEPLAAADRNNGGAQYTLLVSLNALGEVSRELGETAAALEYYRKGLKLAEALAADRNNPEVRWALAVFHGNLGDLHRERDEAAPARDHYRQGMERMEAFAADPNNVQARRELVTFYANLGDLSRHLGELTAARDYYCKGLKLAETLTSADPKNVRERQKLKGCYLHLGELSLIFGERAAARDYYGKALKLAEGFAADESNAHAQWELVAICRGLGWLEQQEFDYPKALAWHQRALALLERLQAAGKNKPFPEFARILQEVKQRVEFCRAVPRAVADLDFALAQPGGSAAEFLLARIAVLSRGGRHAEAAATADRLAERAPKEPGLLCHLACGCGRCVPAAEGKGELTAAEKALCERLAVAAVRLLRAGVGKGHPDGKFLRDHPDLRPFREREDFQKVIQDLGGRLAK